MGKTNKIDTIRRIYDDFAKGDARAILATFAKDVEFRLAEGHPYNPDSETWIGGDEITKRFFEKAGAEWRNWSFTIHEVIETADAVVVEGRYSAVYEPTGRELDAQGCHVWRFNDGKIASFHQFVNTARVQHVMGAQDWDLPDTVTDVFPRVPSPKR